MWLYIVVFILAFFFSFVFNSSTQSIILRFEVPEIRFVPQNPEMQNVHDGTVREKLWTKFAYLREEAIKDLEGYDIEIVYNVAHDMPKYIGGTPEEIEKLTTLVKAIYENEIHVLDNTGKKYAEKDVFAFCYFKYRKLGLDKDIMKAQYLDCFEGDHLVCLVGRVSRYIGMFEGVAEGFLGETEETHTIMFQRAVNMVKNMLDSALEKNPEIKKIYTDIGTTEEERKLHDFLIGLKPRFGITLRKEFPRLSENEIINILAVLD